MKVFFTFCMLLLLLTAYSQSEPHFTIFSNNFSLFNPGYTGVNYKHYGSINYKKQWVGFDDSPSTFTGNYEAKLKKLGGGIGAGYMYDKIGHGISNRIYLNYAYHTNLEIGTLSFGISSIYDQITIDNKFLSLSSTIISQSEKQGKLKANLGVYLKTDKLDIGISSTQLNEPTYEKLSLTSERQYYLISAYKFELSKLLLLKSSILFYSSLQAGLQSWNLDFNNLLLYKNKFCLGFTYCLNDALRFQTGFSFVEKYRIGYAFDYPLNKLASSYLGSHEFVLAIMIN